MQNLWGYHQICYIRLLPDWYCHIHGNVVLTLLQLLHNQHYQRNRIGHLLQPLNLKITYNKCISIHHQAKLGSKYFNLFMKLACTFSSYERLIDVLEFERSSRCWGLLTPICLSTSDWSSFSFKASSSISRTLAFIASKS